MLIKEKKFKKDAILLAKIIKDMWVKYDWILCVTWWWLHLTYYLSKLLGIKQIININVSSYQWKKSKRMKDYSPPTYLNRYMNYLIVDDLVDSWRTVKFIRSKYWLGMDLDTAVLYHKNKCRKPTYYVSEKSADERIDFYYEQSIDEWKDTC